MKKPKYTNGLHCFKCGHKIPDAQLATLRVERTGICSKCAKYYSPSNSLTIALQLDPGTTPAQLVMMESRSNKDILYPALTNQTEEQRYKIQKG